tara:strand:- start:8711 stop:11026 length:2316 start_codon:yes stop_codon:yes gene_type:complete
MGQGYTRNDTGNNIADGNVINASDLDGEFDALLASFNESSGHTHDGTAAEGAPITVLGPVQDFVASATEIKPKTSNTLDIGTASLQFKDMYLDGLAYIDGLGEDILVATNKKVQFRDAALFINSSTDGQLDIAADTEVEITTALLEISADATVGDDLTLKSDASVLGFGADTDVTLTHVHNTGLLVNAAMVVQFRDSAINIGSPADGDLDINADDEIELNSTLIDINGNVEISGTADIAGDLTLKFDDAVLGFGTNTDVTLTHVHNTGLLLNTTSVVQFRDSAINIGSPADGDLDINADDEIELNSTLIDINGNVEISGTADMSSTLQVDGAITSSAGATITTADNTTQLTLISTDADASEGPRLDLRRNSASPADGDVIGTVRYLGENSAGANLVFAEIQAALSDVTEGTVDSSLDLYVRRNNSLTSGLSLNQTQVVFNESGNDVDFRVESASQTNALFLNANTSNFGINRSPTYELDVGANDTDGSVSGRIIAGTDSGASAIFRIHTQATAGARTSSLYFGDSANGGIGRIEYYHDGDSMRFNTNNTERVRITSSGLVGIGTTPSSGVQLDVRGTGVLQLVNTDTVQLLASNGGSTLKNVSNNPLIFGTNNTERMRLLAAGGLTFNGDTAAANALDDYEEGDWTPTGSTNSGSNPSFGSASGKYVKIGKLVHVNGQVLNVNKTGTTAGSQLRIAGLPYTIDDQDAIGSVTWNSITAPYNQINTEANTNEYLIFYSSNPDADNTRTPIDFQHLVDDVSDLHFSVTYHTDQ